MPSVKRVAMDASSTSPPASSSSIDVTMDNGNGGCVEEQQPPSKKRKEADDERVQRAALFMIKSQSLSVPQVRNTMCVCGYLCCFIVRGGVKEGGGAVMC